MKKIFTLITVMLVAMSAMAQDLKSTDYHDQLVITINGETMPAEQAVITITEEAEEGKYTIKLNQFSFMGLLIGDVTMTGVQGDDDSEGFTNYATTQTATITVVATSISSYGAVSTPSISQKTDFPAGGGTITSSNVTTYFTGGSSSQTITYNNGATRSGSISLTQIQERQC